MSDQQSVARQAPGAGSRLQSIAPVLLLVALVGVLSGLFAAYGYYHDALNSFAHALSPWVLLAAVVSARQRRSQAVLRTVTGLLGAVVAFFAGKPVFYGIYYPDVSPIDVDTNKLALWCVLAVIAGTVLGVVFSKIGSADWSGAAATAVAVSLILVATLGEVGSYILARDLPLIVFSLAAVVVVLVLADTTARQLKRTAALTLPLVLVSLALLAAPDLIEQIVFF